jgi:hypothetical protein
MGIRESGMVLRQKWEFDEDFVLLGERRAAMRTEAERVDRRLIILAPTLSALDLILPVPFLLDDLARLVDTRLQPVDGESAPGAEIVSLKLPFGVGKETPPAAQRIRVVAFEMGKHFCLQPQQKNPESGW